MVIELDQLNGICIVRISGRLGAGAELEYLYLRQSTRPENNGIYVGSLDVPPQQQSLKRLMESESGVVYAPAHDSKSGYLLFLREGTLMARPFNPDRIEFEGDAVPIADHVARPI